MADNWTELVALSFNPRFITFDVVNNKCAYGDRGASSYAVDDVYEYDEGTDIATLVLDESAISEFINVEGLAYFNETLYAIIFVNEGGTDRSLSIYSYDGTPDSWSLETKIFDTVGQFDVDHGRLWANNTGIMGYGCTQQATGDAIKYSTNGITWSSGNVGGFKAYRYCAASGNVINNLVHPNTEESFYARFTTAQTPYTASIVKFTFATGALTEVKASDTDGFRISFNQGTYHWCGSAGVYTTNWSSTTNEGSWNILSTSSFQLPVCWAIGNDTKIYRRSGLVGSWVEEDDPSADHTFWNTEVACLALYNDGYVRMVIRDADESHYGVWYYSEQQPLPGGDADRLWIYKTTDGGVSWTSRGVKTA